jgi:anti-sigma B factor antagonist
MFLWYHFFIIFGIILKLNKDMNFEVSHHQHHALVVTNVEKLDISNAAELKSEFVLMNKNGINNIVLDLSKTKYCDSSGLSAVLVANRLCKDTNGKFVLCGLTTGVKKLIEIAQLDKVLMITDTYQSVSEILN